MDFNTAQSVAAFDKPAKPVATYSDAERFLDKQAFDELPHVYDGSWYYYRSDAVRKLLEKYKGDNKPRLPVGVSVIATLPDGHILLGRRKNNTGAGLLSTPGGRIEENETILQCAAREFQEETGATLDTGSARVIGYKEHFRFGGHYVMFYVHAPKFSGSATNVEPDKCEGWDWHKLIDLRPTETTEPPEILAKVATILSGW